MALSAHIHFGIKANGEIWSWGHNLQAALGDNTLTTKSSPVLVVGNHSFIAISGGGIQGAHSNTAALKANGEAWTWGVGDDGTLGDNTTTHKSSPVLVVGNHSFIKISCGISSVLALKANGEAWGWGFNLPGNLGDNTTTAKSSPVLIVGNHSFIDISTRQSTSFFLKANGEVWGAGYNEYSGALGDNTLTNKSSPVLVAGNHSFISICARGGGGAALKANGELWVWGYNSNGQLGDNTQIDKSSPILVVGNHSFIKVYASQNATFALKANGELWGWGQNDRGQLGDNTTTHKSSPVLVVGNHSFINVHSSGNPSDGCCALKANGEAWCWGTGDGIGDNTITSKSSPVLVVGNHSFATLSFLEGGIIEGSTCWGHVTGVTESNVRPFLNNWTGTGSIVDTGDDEKISLGVGQYKISEIVSTNGERTVVLTKNKYITV